MNHSIFFSSFFFSFSQQLQNKSRVSRPSENLEGKTELVTLAWQENKKRESLSEVIQLPIPYELPPQPYGPQGQATLIPSWW